MTAATIPLDLQIGILLVVAPAATSLLLLAPGMWRRVRRWV